MSSRPAPDREAIEALESYDPEIRDRLKAVIQEDKQARID